MKLQNKTHVKDELNKANINIGLSRCAGVNSFNLVWESYNHFAVNAAPQTTIEQVRNFTKVWDNITILINH